MERILLGITLLIIGSVTENTPLLILAGIAFAFPYGNVKLGLVCIAQVVLFQLVVSEQTQMQKYITNSTWIMLYSVGVWVLLRGLFNKYFSK